MELIYISKINHYWLKNNQNRMEKIKKQYHDFHVEIEKSVAERLFQHCEETEDKIISVFRRSLRLYLDSMDQQKNPQVQ